jgi:hypothetical protein
MTVIASEVQAARPQPGSGVGAAAALFFTAPLVAEFLLGNLPIQLLPALILLAPMYGGGALLIRECARRYGRGWPTMLLLGAAYALLEEGFTTQSLFNPNYLHLNLHLLAPGYLPHVGIGAWWTLWMLNVHAFWSIATPIALIEASVPARAKQPWLGSVGLSITAVLFTFGILANAAFSFRQDRFLASPLQFASAGVLCLALIAAAFLIPRAAASERRGKAPNPWIAGLFTLVLGSATLLIPMAWGWGAFWALLLCDAIVLGSTVLWSRKPGWGPQHTLALASGAALAYGWHAFLQVPVVPGSRVIIHVGNALFLLGALALIGFAVKATSRMTGARRQSVTDASA